MAKKKAALAASIEKRVAEFNKIINAPMQGGRVIREGDKVTLPTEPGVVQTVGRGVSIPDMTARAALRMLRRQSELAAIIESKFRPPPGTGE